MTVCDSRNEKLPRGRCAADACARHPASAASALGRSERGITDLENLIECGEDGAGFMGAYIFYAASKRHHHQGALTSNEFMGDGVIGRRIRISIKLLVNVCLRSRGFQSLDNIYGPLLETLCLIYCKLCRSRSLAGCFPLISTRV